MLYTVMAHVKETGRSALPQELGYGGVGTTAGSQTPHFIRQAPLNNPQ